VSARLGALQPTNARPRTSGNRSAGLVIGIATVVALGIRLFTLSRPGFLAQSTEYDDGVYLGGAIRLTQGVMPYHDYAFVQPPGILLLMTPVALVARATSTAAGLALARVLTALASTACVPLAGHLVRRRGILATALTCAILAVYPADIASAHTLLLEPWMNLLCLLGANAAFSRGRLTDCTSRLVWAGAALGFASVVKYWAMAPAAVLLVCCLLVADQHRVRRLVAYVSALAVAFVVPSLPFAIYAGPSLYFRSTVTYQAARAGSPVPFSLRLAHITGLTDLLNGSGHIAWAGGSSLFAQSVVADTIPAQPGALAYLVALVLAVIIAAGLVLGRRDIMPADWFALGTVVIALIAICVYSAFFYHYPAFPGPWLAIIAGIALSTLVRRLSPAGRPSAISLVASVLGAAMVIQLIQVSETTLPAGWNQISTAIPPGACVFSDQVSLLIASDRFEAARPDCPVVIDSLATTLVLTHGVSSQAGAAKNAKAKAAWRAIISKAQYVWLSPNVWHHLPWRDGYPPSWFSAQYRQIAPATGYIPGLGTLYIRRLTGLPEAYHSGYAEGEGLLGV
jgi:alpha-1,2-mannosyltransferase